MVRQYTQVANRLPCVQPIPKNKIRHDGVRVHSLKKDVPFLRNSITLAILSKDVKRAAACIVCRAAPEFMVPVRASLEIRRFFTFGGAWES